jgi:hypothetical protein
MIGFLIGAVCLVGLIKVLRHGRGYGRCGGGWGGHYGHHHGGYGYRGGGGPRFFLRMLFERLDTTPGQEKVIVAELEHLWERKRALGDEFVQTRRDVARAMRGELFDEVALSEAFGRQDALLVELRAAASVALKTVHDALDERQRKLAADMLEGGFGHFGGGHGGNPYRRAWA